MTLTYLAMLYMLYFDNAVSKRSNDHLTWFFRNDSHDSLG